MKIKMKLDPNNAGQMNAARAFFEILAGVTPLKVEGENVDITAAPIKGAVIMPKADAAKVGSENPDRIVGTYSSGPGAKDPIEVEVKPIEGFKTEDLERKAKLAKRREKAAAAKKAKDEAEVAQEEAVEEEAEVAQEEKGEAVEEETPTYTLEDVRALITKKVAEGHKDAMFAKIRTMDRRDDTKKFSVPNLAPAVYGDFMIFMEGLK